MELENIVANTVYLKAREGKKLYVDFMRISMLLGAVHKLYNGLKGGGGFRNLLYALYEGERGVCADVI